MVALDIRGEAREHDVAVFPTANEHLASRIGILAEQWGTQGLIILN